MSDTQEQTMQKKPTTIMIASALSLALGAGVGRAIPVAPPKPEAAPLQRVCVEADGSARVFFEEGGPAWQIHIQKDHAAAVKRQSGAKLADVVPPALSSALHAVVAESTKLAHQQP